MTVSSWTLTTGIKFAAFWSDGSILFLRRETSVRMTLRGISYFWSKSHFVKVSADSIVVVRTVEEPFRFSLGYWSERTAWRRVLREGWRAVVRTSVSIFACVYSQGSFWTLRLERNRNLLMALVGHDVLRRVMLKRGLDEAGALLSSSRVHLLANECSSGHLPRDPIASCNPCS